MPRRLILLLILMAVSLHLAAIARTILPAQDGLKFLRVARQFQNQPWDLVVRNTDQHPLYPAIVALVEPVLARLAGSSPECWRISAQLVSVMASLLTLWPLYWLSRRLFDTEVAALSVFVWVLLPLPAEIGHDTLADPLALLGSALALMCAERAYVTRSVRYAVACGLVSGIGFLARPEVAVVPVALSMAFGWRWIQTRSWTIGGFVDASVRRRFLEIPDWQPKRLSLAGAWIGLGLVVGFYALVKGEVSEKLAVRQAAGLSPSTVAIRSSGHVLMPGMKAQEWDFSAKEESGNPARLPLGRAFARLVSSWAESLAWVGALLAVLGLVRVRSGPGRVVVACYLGLFGLILVRHASALGYLSGRHVLSMALLSTPWTAAGLRSVGRRVSGWTSPEARWPSRLKNLSFLTALVLASIVQVRPAHASRWGYREAGRWISRHAGSGDAVLDTRGWAAFVANQPTYDYWHVRQALSDSRLTYIVVDREEREAQTDRARSLRALLAETSRLVVGFPSRSGGSGQDVLVYQFHRPRAWKGHQP